MALVLSDSRPTKSPKQDELRPKPIYAMKKIVLSTQHCMQNTHLDALLFVLYWLDEIRETCMMFTTCLIAVVWITGGPWHSTALSKAFILAF